MKVEVTIHLDTLGDAGADKIPGVSTAASKLESCLRRIDAAVKIAIAAKVDGRATGQTVQNESFCMAAGVIYNSVPGQAEGAAFENRQGGILRGEADHV